MLKLLSLQITTSSIAAFSLFLAFLTLVTSSPSIAGVKPDSADGHSIRLTSTGPIDEPARELIREANRLDIIGQYEKAIELSSSAYAMAQKSGDTIAESRALFILGQIHFYHLKHYTKSLAYLKRSLTLIEKTDDAVYHIHTLASIGNVLTPLGKSEEALSYFHNALQLYERKKDIPPTRDTYLKLILFDVSWIESYIFLGIGNLYLKQGEADRALKYFHDSLISSRRVGNGWVIQEALSSIGDALKLQQEPELAIVFYKQSVQMAEAAKTDLAGNSPEAQNAYLKTVSLTYRNLAGLLLSQGRVIEAQQVLELLKNQEMREFTRDTRTTNQPTPTTPLNPLENPLSDAFVDKIALGKALTQCEIRKCTQRSQLQRQVTEANQEFDHLIKRLKTALKQQEIQDPAQLQNQEFTRNAQNIILANPKVSTLLLYPLVLDDQLWLVWATQAGKTGIVFDSKSILVTRKDLSTQVEKLRAHLTTPHSNLQDLQQVSYQLYQWLIEPIRPALNQQKIQQIVFSLDRATRYIPMSALYDGKQYLIENFALSTILTSQTDTTDKLSPNLQENLVLGFGLTQAQAGFSALPAVRLEIDRIIRQTTPSDSVGIFPGREYLDFNFNENTLREHIPDHRILHLATHGSFLTHNPDESFLVLGNGQKLKIATIEAMKNLAGTHLVVLSACETGKGGLNSEGLEVAGIGHYFLRSGAKSVMASLWLVNDPATAYLMEQFYQQLAAGQSKPYALRQVQQTFIKDQVKLDDLKSRDRAGVRSDIEGYMPDSLMHPYYWAPFILIGNPL